MTAMSEETYLWYVPNQIDPGHRGDEVREDHDSLDTLTEHALAVERAGFGGALIGTGWHRPDTLTVATALAARTRTFRPLAAVRPGYWDPAHLAASAATLDHLSEGRALLNIVTGTDSVAEYGDPLTARADRYARTEEFLQVLRRLWTEPSVTHHGRFYSLDGARLSRRPVVRGERTHPTLYFGGASPEAERVAAAQADVQLFWGEPYDAISARIERLRTLGEEVGRAHAPLEFGLRITVLARDTAEEAWQEARRRVRRMEAASTVDGHDGGHGGTDALSQEASVGQSRLHALGAGEDVLDDNLFTAPSRVGGRGAATTWLVGSHQEVAAALTTYRSRGITHFILSDTPYLQEVARLGEHLLPLLPGRSTATTTASRRELHVA